MIYKMRNSGFRNGGFASANIMKVYIFFFLFIQCIFFPLSSIDGNEKKYDQMFEYVPNSL